MQHTVLKSCVTYTDFVIPLPLSGCNNFCNLGECREEDGVVWEVVAGVLHWLPCPSFLRSRASSRLAWDPWQDGHRSQKLVTFSLLSPADTVTELQYFPTWRQEGANMFAMVIMIQAIPLRPLQCPFHCIGAFGYCKAPSPGAMAIIQKWPNFHLK